MDKTAATEHLRDSVGPYDAFNLIPQPAWCAAPDGSLKFCNHLWLSSTGLGWEEAEGLGWTSVLHVEDASRVEQRWKSAMADRTTAEAEARMRKSVRQCGYRRCRL
jgi:hypothetical protein